MPPILINLMKQNRHRATCGGGQLMALSTFNSKED